MVFKSGLNLEKAHRALITVSPTHMVRPPSLSQSLSKLVQPLRRSASVSVRGFKFQIWALTVIEWRVQVGSSSSSPSPSSSSSSSSPSSSWLSSSLPSRINSDFRRSSEVAKNRASFLSCAGVEPSSRFRKSRSPSYKKFQQLLTC